jgi:hypothetical protein
MDEVGAVDADGKVLCDNGVGGIDDGAKAGRAVEVRMVRDRGAALEPPRVTSNTANVAVTSTNSRAATITGVTRRISRRRSEDAQAGERRSTGTSDAGPGLWGEP